MTTIIGIDPGKNGGIAWCTEGDVRAFKMPPTPVDMWDLIQVARRPDCFCYLEKVHGMPGEGSRSIFTFGVGFGHMVMALVGNKIPYELVTPQRWKRSMGLVFPKKKGLTKTQIKNKDKEKAQSLFPEIKVTHALADALLIMEYGRRLRC